ncbi:MAG: hypothetical protein HC802_21775 [Caldilineaceae bacterium]|nr:hypothetical protein [Caldilineaceae bacterium]
MTDADCVEYSPWLFGTGAVMFYYMVLALFQVVTLSPPDWAWNMGWIFLALGLIPRFATSRLLWLQLYQLSGFVIVSLLNWLLAWLMLANNRGILFTLTMIVLVSVFAVGNAVATFRGMLVTSVGSGFGYTGILDPESGWLNPYKVSVEVAAHRAKTEAARKMTWGIGPLVGGITSLLLYYLSDEGQYFLIAVVVLGLLWSATAVAGWLSRRLVWVYGWEKAHGKPITIVR